MENDDIYFKRKVDRWLSEWKNNIEHSPALIYGIRQCGKTKSIKNFGYSNYLNVVYINFWEKPDYIQDFKDSLEVDKVISNLSLRSNTDIKEKTTLIILDEIQECPRARLFLKSINEDRRYEVIASGSYLGINGYNKNDGTPIPIGSEDIFEMKTMDFEEFLWANNFDNKWIEFLKNYLNNKTKIDDTLHSVMKNHFNNYLCVGGFPKAVKSFLKNNNLKDGFNENKKIIKEMKADFGRRVDKDGKPIFNHFEVSRIQNAFELIPTFLAKENKRYILTKINGGNGQDKKDALTYLKEAGIIYKVYNISETTLPLETNKIESQFKIFPTNIGILSTLLGLNTILSINRGDYSSGKGAVYEALVFDALYKNDFDIYYFSKESGLEIDFFIEYEGYSTMLEVKSQNGNAKSAKTILKNKEHYGITKLIKICDSNIGYNNDILTIPHYLTFLIRNDFNF